MGGQGRVSPYPHSTGSGSYNSTGGRATAIGLLVSAPSTMLNAPLGPTRVLGPFFPHKLEFLFLFFFFFLIPVENPMLQNIVFVWEQRREFPLQWPLGMGIA